MWQPAIHCSSAKPTEIDKETERERERERERKRERELARFPRYGTKLYWVVNL